MKNIFSRDKVPGVSEITMYLGCPSCHDLIAVVWSIIVTHGSLCHDLSNYVGACGCDCVHVKGCGIPCTSTTLSITANQDRKSLVSSYA